MRKIVPLFPLLLAALAGCAQSPADIARAQERTRAAREALGKELAGLTPKRTSECIDSFQTTSMKAFGPTLVYRASRDLAYVSDTGGGCEAIANGDILVTKSNTGRLCRGDIGTTVSATTRMQSGSCALGEFTVYGK